MMPEFSDFALATLLYVIEYWPWCCAVALVGTIVESAVMYITAKMCRR